VKTIRFMQTVSCLLALSCNSMMAQPGFWQPTSGPKEGVIHVVREAAGMLYATTATHPVAGSGVYRSSDDGVSWHQLTNGLPAAIVDQYCMASIRDSILLLGVCANDFGGPLSGMFRSTDRGDSWVRVDSNLSSNGFVHLTADTVGFAYGSVYGGPLFRSGDDGRSWQSLGRPHNSLIKSIAAAPNGILYLLKEDGILRSTDHGTTWDSLAFPYPGPGFGYAEDILAATSDTVLASSTYGIYRSIDRGETWEQVYTQWATCLAQGVGRVFFAGTANTGPLYSRDGGTTWTRLDTGLPFPCVTAICARKNGSVLIAAGTNSYKLSNSIFTIVPGGREWRHLAELGAPNKSVNCLAVLRHGAFLFAGAGSLYKSSDAGTLWLPTAASSTNLISSRFDNSVYTVSARSTDDGVTWLNTGVSGAYAIRPNGAVVCFSAGNYTTPFVFSSTNGGETWDRRSVNGYTEPRTICFAESPKGHFFTGTFAHVFRSTDNGENWTRHWSGLTSPTVTAIGFDSAGYGFAGTYGGGVFRTSDDGETWSKVSYGRLDTLCVSSIMGASDGTLFVGTGDNVNSKYNGIYRSSDHGDTWFECNAGLNTLNVLSLAADPSGLVVAGMGQGGVAVGMVSAIPAPLWPFNGARNQPVALDLQWASHPSFTSFHVQVARDSLFAAELVRDDHGVAGKTLALSGLDHVTRYFWRVRTEEAGEGAPFSPVFQFTTTLMPPEPLLPESGATGITRRPTCVWNRPATAASFHLQMSTDSMFAGGYAVNDSTIVDSSRTAPNLNYLTDYFWRVRARNDAGYGRWSSIWQFRSQGRDPAVPVNVAPTHMLVGIDTPVTVRWIRPQGATLFHLQLATDSTFASGVPLADSLTVDSFSVIRSLSFLTSYWWRVNAFTPGTGTSAYSDSTKFTVGLPLPAIVALAGPPRDTVVATDTLRIRWRRTGPLVDKYWIEYSKDSLFRGLTDQPVVIHPALPDTTDVLRVLENNTSYYWRARAHNPSGWGLQCEPWHFHRLLTAISEQPEGVPDRCMLFQNYPNPFNPSTTIKFGIPEKMRVHVAVFNILGEAVAEVVDEEMEAGYHSIQFDAVKLASGMYFFRMQADAFTETRKLLIIR
jgi:photosystem II stability/assembly factor-like uncharacterized protein